jgi:D-threo-aldose 1-dehydrogenase
MQRRRVGRTGVQVTSLALGCAPLAGLFSPVGEEQARSTIDAAWDAGIRTFDTAPHYGAGLSERRVGAALRERPRDEFVLSTKVGHHLGGATAADGEYIFAEGPDLARIWDFSRDAVLRSLEESLERLGLDRIDTVFVHDPDEHLDEAIGAAVPALAELRDAGVIGAVGAGMSTTGPLARIVRESDVDCVLIAGRYTLLDQSAADDLFPACEERGVAAFGAGVFNSGVLADPRPGAHYDYAPASEEVLGRARRIAALCARHGVTTVAAALHFSLAHPAVTGLIVGARSPAEVAASADALASDVPAALWDELAAEGLIT